MKRIIAFMILIMFILSLMGCVKINEPDDPGSADTPEPGNTAAAGIQADLPASIVIGTGSNTDPTVIGFGGREWAVIGYNGTGVASEMGTMTLLLANFSGTASIYGTTHFDQSRARASNAYDGSTLQTAMNSAYDSLSAGEKLLVKPRDLEGGGNSMDPDKIMGPGVTDAGFWPLSANEANSVNSEMRKFDHDHGIWWLRSPGGGGTIRAACVIDSGTVSVAGFHVINYLALAIRPAFILNLSSAIFTSDAAGGKSAAIVGNGLSASEPPTGVIKFTMQDTTGQATPILTFEGTTNNTNELRFGYTEATTGTNQYVSCVLVGTQGTDSGVVKYYGKLANCTSVASGTLSIPLSTVANGTYMLRIFSEQANGDLYTDFCSAPVTMDLSVSGGQGTVDKPVMMGAQSGALGRASG